MDEAGRGELFWPDGRRWGVVEYEIDVTPPTLADLGRIRGTLRPIPRSRTPMPFYDIALSPGNASAALQLADGRWWLCLLQPDGIATNAGGIHPAGPQPSR